MGILVLRAVVLWILGVPTPFLAVIVIATALVLFFSVWPFYVALLYRAREGAACLCTLQLSQCEEPWTYLHYTHQNREYRYTVSHASYNTRISRSHASVQKLHQNRRSIMTSHTSVYHNEHVTPYNKRTWVPHQHIFSGHTDLYDCRKVHALSSAKSSGYPWLTSKS